ncbi:MAG: cytochrome d terminal oxidase subunit 1 [Gammaproteobacteria bacterium 39-13]|nr:cytochrome ubiquinol oxidase subunit I [Gammaproteobacteria bacterium]OJV93068.1 MAG: cytochrome d terminal oxidase subunit 1 [Gammaproteobacteria bacterium 39-13]
MIDESVVALSRFQFALTALYHFLFVPLTLGLGFILAIMESVYVLTGKEIYKDMTRFWGKLFGINFAMGVATGITMEFQFGTNWAYYSYFVGDIFGVPLAIEGFMAFFLESTLIGLFFFGWDRLSKAQHLAVTWLVAIGANLSALWILIANAWMQHPIGAEFNYDTMRMELGSFAELFYNPVAQVKFVHTVAAGYVTGSIFVLAISAYYLLRHRDVHFARRSFAIASGFGLAAILSALVLGDASGYTVGEVQKTKLAAIEGEWETQKPPASFTLFGIPNDKEKRMDYAITIPGVLGIIATHSTNEPVIGINDLVKNHEQKIRNGIRAQKMLEEIKSSSERDPAVIKEFDRIKSDLGYGLLLKRFVPDIQQATDEDIQKAAEYTIPKVAPLFWTFRIMVGLGFLMLLLFVFAFYYNIKGHLQQRRWLLWFAIISLPFPWIAAECGWIVAEYGRQPWAIGEILPTFAGVSTVSSAQVLTSIAGFALFYTLLLVADVYLMIKYAKLGPSTLGTKRYHFEKQLILK